MGRLTILAIAVAAVISGMPRSASAERYYPWCAWYDEWTYSCAYTSRAQCLASISGVGGMCKVNPYEPPGAADRRTRRRY